LRPGVGDGYGWWGVLPIVGVGMGRSYPMGTYLLPSLPAAGPERPRLPEPGGGERREGHATTFLAAAQAPGGQLERQRGGVRRHAARGG
jgi:hypothetical protein